MPAAGQNSRGSPFPEKNPVFWYKNIMKNRDKLLKKAAEFHGHTCPGLAIGVRVADYVMSEFSSPRSADEELVAVVENDSCAVDAVQALLGCTFGKGNLIHKDYGKQVYTFYKRPAGTKKIADAVRIAVNWKAPEETAAQKEMWRRYSAGDRSEDVLKSVHKRKSDKIKSVMSANGEDIFTIKKFKGRPPCAARIFQSVKCADCGEKTMETRIRLAGGKELCLPCFEREIECKR